MASDASCGLCPAIAAQILAWYSWLLSTPWLRWKPISQVVYIVSISYAVRMNSGLQEASATVLWKAMSNLAN